MASHTDYFIIIDQEHSDKGECLGTEYWYINPDDPVTKGMDEIIVDAANMSTLPGRPNEGKCKFELFEKPVFEEPTLK